MASNSKQVFLKSGQFLFLQGEVSDSFFILKSGRVEVLICDEIQTPTEEEVIANARRIAIISEANTPIGDVGAFEGTPRSASIRALEPCELIWVVGGQRALVEWVSGNLQAGLLITRNLVSRNLTCHSDWHRLNYLKSKTKVYIDNFIVIYTIFNTRIQNPGTPFAQFIQRGRKLITNISPSEANQLGKIERNIPAEAKPPINKPFPEIESFYFFNHILSQPDVYLTWLIAQVEPHPLMYIMRKLVDGLPLISTFLHHAMLKLEKTLKSFFGESGLIQAYVQLYPFLNEEQIESSKPYYEKLLEISEDLSNRIKSLWGETFPNFKQFVYDIEMLKDILAGKISSKVEKENVEIIGDYDLTGAISKIGLDALERDYFDLCLGIHEAEPAQIYNAYWKLYPRMWQANQKLNFIELTGFLRYGFASPKPIIKPEKVNFELNASGPVLFSDQWLARIYNGESPVSRNELGQSFEDVMKAGKTETYKENERDPGMDKVYYEVDQMMSKAGRAFSAGRSEIAVLRRTEEEISAYKESMVTPAKIAQELVNIIRLDNTAFMREVRVFLSERSEFLPKEILPFVILLPSAGNRAICWQEFEGRNKDTPGRLIFPMVAEDELRDMVISVIAHFRWDIAKSIAGTDWMNPADGGLTGKYFDYCNFYKKSQEISDEQKEKLNEQFANILMDVDKFAMQYEGWIKYESQGIQKLDRVARRIFAEFCPFNLNTRKRLIRQPAYTEILRKDSNRRLKRKQELERRIYKLEREGISVGNTFDSAMKIHQEIPE